MEIGGDGNGSGDGESQPSSSDSGQVLALSKRIMEEVLRSGGGEGKTIIIAIVQQGNGVIEDVRQVEHRSSEDNLLAGGTRKKALQLKFFGEVPDTVRTGTVLTSKTGECFKLVLVDSETGDTVDCVPESSAEAEIVVLLDGKNDMTRENFERRIIKTGEKKKPHFVKRVYINLKEGVGYLRDVKLGQESDWTKKCRCRLGARVGQSLYAWTQPFEIIDKRDKDNEKHFPPKLSSEVWRLVRICRDGKPCKRLTGKNIETLGDFLFWFHVNRQGLKRILLDGGSGESKWKAIVDHAETCTTDDQRMHYDDDPRMYSHKSPNEPQTSVVYNFVGKLKGVIKESQFVPIDNLSAHEKDHAYELLGSVLEGSAFKERYNTPFNIEASLPYSSSHGVNASTSSSLQPLCQNIYQATERGSSSQSIYPNNVPYSMPSHSRVSEEMGELCNPANPGTLPEINAGTSEDETRALSRRRSTTYSFEENGMQPFWHSDHMEMIPSDATYFQQDRTIHDDFASLVAAPQNLCGDTPSDLDVLGICFEDYRDPTSLLPERHDEIHAGSSTNWLDTDEVAAYFISYTTETCGSASTGVFVGMEDENEQLRGACPISFRTRGWILMAHVLKWRLSIKKIHKVRAGDTRKRKR